MKIVCVYNFPTPIFGPQHARLAERFVSSYVANPPLMDHMMIVVSNGGRPNGEAYKIFAQIKPTKFLFRENVGMDIGSYQYAAQNVICDLMVFFGGGTYFRGPGWLRRMVEVYQSLGDGLYGASGNQGDGKVRVWPHIRTTGFWCSPKLINEHPFRVTDNSQRYPYEHGQEGLTTWVLNTGRSAWVVTFNDVKPLNQCDSLVGGFHNANQEQLIVGDTLSCVPYFHCS
jgi:hypothetical protein